MHMFIVNSGNGREVSLLQGFDVLLSIAARPNEEQRRSLRSVIKVEVLTQDVMSETKSDEGAKIDHALYLLLSTVLVLAARFVYKRFTCFSISKY
jgi:hypothetical protein